MAQLFNLIAGFLHCRCNWFPFASFCREAITCGKLHRIGTACFSLKSPDILSLFFMLLVFLKTNLFFFEYRIGTIFFYWNKQWKPVSVSFFGWNYMVRTLLLWWKNRLKDWEMQQLMGNYTFSYLGFWYSGRTLVNYGSWITLDVDWVFLIIFYSFVNVVYKQHCFLMDLSLSSQHGILVNILELEGSRCKYE